MILATLFATLVHIPNYTLMGNPVSAQASKAGASVVRKMPPLTKAESQPCSINVIDQEPAAVLNGLSKQTGINLILLSVPENKVTLNFKGVRFIDAVRHICAILDISFLKVGSTYVLAKVEKLKAAYPDEWYAIYPDDRPQKPPVEPDKPTPIIVTELMQTNYVSASHIVQVLTSLYDKGLVKIIAGPIQENPTVTAQDSSATTGTQTNILGEDGQGSTTSLAGKTIIFKGEASIVREAMELARKLDTLRPQVAIQVTVHDISDGALKDLGITWSFGNVTVSEKDTKGVSFGSFDRTGLSFSAAIKALETQDKAKLLASPNISVLDGERAFVLVGDRINFPVLVGFGQGNVPIFSKQEERVGIYLQVAATVSTDDQITMSLYPQVSTITGFLEANGASYPQIATREAQTTIRVNSGETFVMGGLLRTEEVNQFQKVPILGDLPFIGELFKKRRTQKTTSQVIISITPRVLKGNESR